MNEFGELCTDDEQCCSGMCAPDADGRVLLPSVVRYVDRERRQIGFDALAARAEDPTNTITSAKRLMGRGLTDIANRDAMPYRLIDEGGMVNLQMIDGRVRFEVNVAPAGNLDHRNLSISTSERQIHPRHPASQAPPV